MRSSRSTRINILSTEDCSPQMGLQVMRGSESFGTFNASEKNKKLDQWTLVRLRRSKTKSSCKETKTRNCPRDSELESKYNEFIAKNEATHKNSSAQSNQRNYSRFLFSVASRSLFNHVPLSKKKRFVYVSSFLARSGVSKARRLQFRFVWQQNTFVCSFFNLIGDMKVFMAIHNVASWRNWRWWFTRLLTCTAALECAFDNASWDHSKWWRTWRSCCSWTFLRCAGEDELSVGSECWTPFRILSPSIRTVWSWKKWKSIFQFEDALSIYLRVNSDVNLERVRCQECFAATVFNALKAIFTCWIKSRIIKWLNNCCKWIVTFMSFQMRP